MNKKVKGAEKAYVKLALAYDRFIKAGNIIKKCVRRGLVSSLVSTLVKRMHQF